MSDNSETILGAIKDITTDPVAKMVKQRLSNPFFLYFISSWLMCNWDRFFLLLFSSGVKMEERIEIVKKMPSNSVFFGMSIPHTHTIWYPFLASLILVIGSPFLNYMVDIIQNGIINKKENNDSERNNAKLDLKIKGVEKEVSYSYARRKAELDAEKINKKIEFDIETIGKEYEALLSQVRDANDEIKLRSNQLSQVKKDYESTMLSVEKLRNELINKEIAINQMDLNLISRKNKLDEMTKEMSRMSISSPISSISNTSVGINSGMPEVQTNGLMKGLWEDNKVLGRLNGGSKK